MRILDFLTHPPFQYTLAKSGHDFVVAASKMYAGWPEQLRPLPDNLEVVEVPEDPGSFDVVIVSTREQYSRIDGRVDPGRIVFLSHTVLHPWDVEFFCRLPADVEVVYVSDHKRASFGRLGNRGRTIPLGVDAGEFDGYTGEQSTVLNVTNRYARQEDRDYPLFRRLTKGLDSQVVGHGNEEIPGAYPATDFEHLQQIYRQHRCFVNTDAQGRLHLCTLEALATGMPLVTVPTAELEPHVQGGVNAFVSDDEGELRGAVEGLLSDPGRAREVGAAGRQMAQEHFGVDRFLSQWNGLFEKRVASAKPRRPRGSSVAGPSAPSVAINAMSVGGEMTGIGHHAQNLVNALALTDAQQHYSLLTGNSDLTPPDGRFQQWDMRAGGARWEQLQLPELLSEREVDLYHNPAFGLPVVKSCPYVATVHDCIPRLFPEYAPEWLRDFFEHWAPRWVQLADQIICVSEHTRHDLIHLYGVDPERTSVVYQCADKAYRPVTDRTRVRLVRDRYDLDRPYVLSVGRVELRKNVVGLLRAFEILQQTYGDELLLVLAGPKDEDGYDPHGDLPPPGRHGPIAVTGYVPTEDLAALYCGCEVFCYPSFYEGFGIPVLEAMQCGAPVVASRVSSVPEVGGEAPLYVNPYDPEHIAHALKRVIEDRQLREQMTHTGMARAEEFSLQQFGEGTVLAYQRALAG